jgi:hypothetical protein
MDAKNQCSNFVFHLQEKCRDEGKPFITREGAQETHDFHHVWWSVETSSFAFTIQLKTSRPPASLFPTCIGDVVAHFLGFNECYRLSDLREFRELISFSDFVSKHFDPFHHHWAVETPTRLFEFLAASYSNGSRWQPWKKADALDTLDSLRKEWDDDSDFDDEEINDVDASLKTRPLFAFADFQSFGEVRGQKVKFLSKLLCYALVYENQPLVSALEYFMSKTAFVPRAYVRASVLKRDWNMLQKTIRGCLSHLLSPLADTLLGLLIRSPLLSDSKSVDAFFNTLLQVDLRTLFAKPPALTFSHLFVPNVQKLVSMLDLAFDGTQLDAESFWHRRACEVCIIQAGCVPEFLQNDVVV